MCRLRKILHFASSSTPHTWQNILKTFSLILLAHSPKVMHTVIQKQKVRLSKSNTFELH